MKYPFRWTPGSIGLKGNTYKRAEAEYSFTGQELEYKLLSIDYIEDTSAWSQAKLDLDKKFEKISEYNYQVETTTLRYEDDEQTRKLLEVERQFNKISQEEYDRAKLELDFEGDELKLEQLHHQFKNNKISEKAYTKAVANINGTAWVNGEIKLDASGKTFLEMDWNEAFIEGLRDKGYTGLHDEEIISTWWTNVNMHDIEDFAPTLETNVTPLGKGKSEIS